MTLETPEIPALSVRPIKIEEEMRSSYLDYAMCVIVSRALPDIRDGLKPVQRRILYAMSDHGHCAPELRYSKSATVSSVRCSVSTTRTATPRSTTRWCGWPSRSPCATRSSTARATSAPWTATRPPPTATPRRASRAIATELLADIDKNTVDFVAELRRAASSSRSSLPARLPTCLSTVPPGIAVGMATNIPPHNLGELCDAIALLIDNPEATRRTSPISSTGPDFPTGGVIFRFETVRLPNTQRHRPDDRDAATRSAPPTPTARGRIVSAPACTSRRRPKATATRSSSPSCRTR